MEETTLRKLSIFGVTCLFTILDEADINEIMDKGLGKLFGFTPVSPQGRLTTVWAKIKSER